MSNFCGDEMSNWYKQAETYSFTEGEDPDVAVARQITDPEFLRKILDIADDDYASDVAIAAALNPYAPPESLALILNNPKRKREEVGFNAASNPSAPTEILVAILEEDSESGASYSSHIAKMAAANISCPVAARVKWLIDTGKLTKEELRNYLNDKVELGGKDELEELEGLTSKNNNWYKTAAKQQDFSFLEQRPSEYDVLEEQLGQEQQAVQDVLEEFKTKEPDGRQPWPVVPLGRVKKIWEDYMKTGFVRDEKGIEQIAQRMIANTHRLFANTYLMGHTEQDPKSEFEDFGMDEEAINNFGDYATDEKGNWRLSDSALRPLQEDAFELAKTYDPVQQLQIIDRMFGRVHPRSDLAALFIEGGSSSLDLLFGRPSEVEASTRNWYKKAQVTDISQIEVGDELLYNYPKAPYRGYIRVENINPDGTITGTDLPSGRNQKNIPLRFEPYWMFKGKK